VIQLPHRFKLDETAVFEHVELEPRGNAGLLRDLMHVAHSHGRQPEDFAVFSTDRTHEIIAYALVLERNSH